MRESRESLDRLLLEVEELRASRKRLVLGADADRRRIERELHDGPQQHLVAIAVNLQHARRLVDVDPGAARTLLGEMTRDVRDALDETRRLAHRIYPPLLEAGGLRAALRSASASVGGATRIQVSVGADCPPELAGTVYFCSVEALESMGAGARSTITVRQEQEELVLEIAGASDGPAVAASDLALAQDRVEALGGRLTVESEPGRRDIRVRGSLPISR